MWTRSIDGRWCWRVQDQIVSGPVNTRTCRLFRALASTVGGDVFCSSVGVESVDSPVCHRCGRGRGRSHQRWKNRHGASKTIGQDVNGQIESCHVKGVEEFHCYQGRGHPGPQRPWNRASHPAARAKVVHPRLPHPRGSVPTQITIQRSEASLYSNSLAVQPCMHAGSCIVAWNRSEPIRG